MTQAEPTTAIPTIAVGAPRIVPGERRSPLVVVPATIGDVTVVFGVAALKKNRMVIRSPLAADGTTAVSAPPEIQHAVSVAVLAAVQASPEAMEHLGHR